MARHKLLLLLTSIHHQLPWPLKVFEEGSVTVTHRPSHSAGVTAPEGNKAIGPVWHYGV